jgi:LemA protein
VLKGKIIVAAVAIIVIVLIGTFAGLYFTTYNNLVAKNANVDNATAQVEQELQRRYDLIPNIVNAAKGYMSFEASLLTNITALRSQWDQAVQSGDMNEINNATSAMESGVKSLTITVEAYPNLDSAGVVQSLMITLEGTENRISTERMRYNDAVRDFNTAIAVFPANLWSAGWGFHTKTYFQAQVGATTVPSVNL